MPPSSKRGDTKYRCTACSSHIKTSFEAFLHPLLKVLICRKCHTDYGAGDFSLFNDPDVGPGVDENGDDNYCRWCVDGGDLFACGNEDTGDGDRCHYAFCTDCIKRNCPDEDVLNQENFPPGSDFKWKCFACEPEKLKKHRQEAQEIILALSGRDLKRPTSSNVSMGKDSPCVKSNGIVGEVNFTKEPEKSKERESESAKKDKDERPSRERVTRDKEERLAKEKEQKLAREKEERAAKEQRDRPNKDRTEKDREDREKETEPKSGDKATKEAEDKTSKDGEERPAKDRDQQVSKERDDNRREKERDRDSSADDVQASKRRKTDSGVSSSSNGDSTNKEVTKEPEATLMPPVAPPKPADSILRRLAKKSTPEAPKTPTNPVGSASGSSSSKAYSKIQANLPSSVNNPVPKVRLPSMPSVPSHQEAPRTNGVGLKSKPLSKQLKATNEPIKPSCKVPLNDIELKKRLETFSQVKQNCISEIGSKFQNIIEMFQSKDLSHGKAILKYEIEDLEKPLQEFNIMLRDLKSLYHSQT